MGEVQLEPFRRSLLARLRWPDRGRLYVGDELLVFVDPGGRQHRIPLHTVGHLQIRGRVFVGIGYPSGWIELPVGRLLAGDQFDKLCQLRDAAQARPRYSTWEAGELRHSRPFTWDELLSGPQAQATAQATRLELRPQDFRCGGLALKPDRSGREADEPFLDLDLPGGGTCIRVRPGRVLGADGMVLAEFDNYPDLDWGADTSRGFRLDLREAGFVHLHLPSRRIYGDLGPGLVSLDAEGAFLELERPCHPLLLFMLAAVQQFLAMPGPAAERSLHRQSRAAWRADRRRPSSVWRRRWIGWPLLVAGVWSISFLVIPVLLPAFIIWLLVRARPRRGEYAMLTLLEPGPDCRKESLHLRGGELLSCPGRGAEHGIARMAADLGLVDDQHSALELRHGRTHQRTTMRWLTSNCDAEQAGRLRAWLDALHPHGIYAWRSPRGTEHNRSFGFAEVFPGQAAIDRCVAVDVSAGPGASLAILVGPRTWHVRRVSRFLRQQIACRDPLGIASLLWIDEDAVSLSTGTPLAAVRPLPGLDFALQLPDGTEIRVSLPERRVRSRGPARVEAEIAAAGQPTRLSFTAPVPELLAVTLAAMIRARETG